MRPPPEAEIYAPEFPAGLEWLNVAFLRMNTLLGRGAVLVEFWDFARVNSLRTMPYLKAWHERYADAGLQRDRHPLARLLVRARPRHRRPRGRAARGALPGAARPRARGVARCTATCGWPGRYLFDRTGKLAFIHYGEGEYLETELAIQECRRARPREPLAPVRPEDAPGVLLEPQTADIVAARRPRAARAGARLGGRRRLDRGRRRRARRRASASAPAAPTRCCPAPDVEPGLYEVGRAASRPSRPALRLHGVQFTPAPPAPGGSPAGA